MACTHEKLRCTNNVFYCLICGARVSDPHVGKASEQAKATQRVKGTVLLTTVIHQK